MTSQGAGLLHKRCVEPPIMEPKETSEALAELTSSLLCISSGPICPPSVIFPRGPQSVPVPVHSAAPPFPLPPVPTPFPL